MRCNEDEGERGQNMPAIFEVTMLSAELGFAERINDIPSLAARTE